MYFAFKIKNVLDKSYLVKESFVQTTATLFFLRLHIQSNALNLSWN